MITTISKKLIEGNVCIYAPSGRFIYMANYKSNLQRQRIIASWTEYMKKQDRTFYYHISPITDES